MTNTPTADGPVTGGRHGEPFLVLLGEVDRSGYRREEYFITGVATRYHTADPLAPDGRWSVTPDPGASFRTRVVIDRPDEPSSFNGTVVVEWANVSYGTEICLGPPPGLPYGFAYVSVSAQRVGITGYSVNPAGLAAWDPPRYGDLSIPDDALSYDIFTQAAVLCRDPAGPLGDLRPQKLIAIGGSQSGMWLTTYANAIQPLTEAFDAIMPLLCAGFATDFDRAPAHPDPTLGDRGHSRGVQTRMRSDAESPVMVINTETEAPNYRRVRQPDSQTFRSWEIAGSSHAPRPQMETARRVLTAYGLGQPPASPVAASEVMWLPTVHAALHHVHHWIHDGPPPPSQAPIDIAADGAVIRDEHGNATGGVRLPELEVPRATYRGASDRTLGGSTTPFPAEKCRALYPTHDDYVHKVQRAADAALAAGVILPERRIAYIRDAEDASLP